MVNKLKISSQGQGQTLVFIHGWGVNSAIWQPVVAVLSKNYQVISVDLPGFGDNNQITLSPYSIIEIAKLIAAEITQPAYFIGWSLGGLVASQLALTFPQQVLGLVTVASSPCFLQQANWPGIKPAVLKSFHQQLSQNAEKTIDGFLKIQAMGSPHVREDIKTIRNLVMQKPMANLTVLDQSLSLLETTDLRNQLKNITQPFLRLYGRLDTLVPSQAIELIEQLNTYSESYVFQKASHAPFISEPDEFLNVLTSWLNQQSN